MRLKTKLAAALLGLLAVPLSASAAVIGGTYYAPQYDYSEFFTATDGRNFQVLLVGNPFPNNPPPEMASALLGAMQRAKPRPALTFTYNDPPELPRPYYRLVLIFDSALDLGPDSVCRGQARLRPGQPGLFNVYAVYCRNDQAMSTTTAWTQASNPGDPRVEQLFRELFMVVFSDSQALRPLNGFRNRM
jgi:hypothetical protein